MIAILPDMFYCFVCHSIYPIKVELLFQIGYKLASSDWFSTESYVRNELFAI